MNTDDYKGKRVMTYIRVSTERQAKNGDSIEDQREALGKWAKENGCKIIGEYIDAGFSGAKEYKTRPAFCKMLTDTDTLRPDLLIFTRLDRFTRNPRDYYNVVHDFKRHNLEWKSIWQEFDSTTSSGQAMIGMMLVASKLERDTTSERIIMHNIEKRARGELTSGKMPRGYIDVDKKPVIDPETKDGMQAFFQAYLDGRGLRVAIEEAEKKGVKFSGISSASYVLRNADKYTGMIQNVPTTPYLTQEEAEKILSMRKTPIKKTGFIYLFNGLIYCGECNGRYGSHKRDYRRKEGAQVFYNCSNHYSMRGCGCKVNMNENIIEAYLLDSIAQYIDDLAVTCEAVEDTSEEQEAIKKQIARVKEKTKRAYECYINGIVELDMFKEQKRAFDSELQDLETKLKKPKVSKDMVKNVLPDDWREMYDSLTRENKRAFWFAIIDRIQIGNDRSITYSLKIEN